MKRFAIVCSVGLTLSASAWGQSGAPADDDAVKQQCASAYERAQELKLDNRLVEAREQLVACMADPCPQVAKSHCAEWLVEVERAIPTVVLRFVDAEGQSREDVAVTVDGAPLTETLNGKALDVDPGPHTFVFTPAGGSAVERKVTVAEGERNMRIDVSLAPAGQPTPNSDTPPDGADDGGGFPVAPMLLGGLSLVGFGLLAGFGTSALVTGNKCKPNCSDDQAANVKVKALIADISLGVGVLALGGAIISYFAMSSDDESAASRWRITAGVTPDAAAVTLGGSF
jgi:hypothetical protein